MTRILLFALLLGLLVVAGCGGGGGGGGSTITVTSLTLSIPDNSTVATGGVLHIKAFATYSNGTSGYVNPSWGLVGAIGSIGPDGTFTAAASAAAGTIVATLSGFITNVSISVVVPGALSNYAVVASNLTNPNDIGLGDKHFFYLMAMSGAQTIYVNPDAGSWSVSGGVATIDANTGELTATSSGDGSVSALHNSAASSLPIRVTAPKVSVTGSTVEFSSFVAIAGAQVVFLDSAGNEVGRLTSDSGGQFSGLVSQSATDMYVDSVPAGYHAEFRYQSIYYYTGDPANCKAPIAAPTSGKNYGNVYLFSTNNPPPPPPNCG